MSTDTNIKLTHDQAAELYRMLSRLNANEDDAIFTPAEAAEELRLRDLGYPNPEKTICDWIRKRKIGHAEIGNKSVILGKHIREYKNRDLGRERGAEVRRRRRRTHTESENR